MSDTGAVAHPDGGGDGRVRLALAAVTVLFAVLVVLAASGVRGTDQYWYMADVEALARGLPHVSNNVFPTQILGQPPTIVPPFIHNILPIYMVVPAAWLFGTYAGWLVTNGVASAAVAFVIYRVLEREVSPWAGALGYAVYLLLPLTFWQSAQPWAEPCIALFSAAAVWAYGRGGRGYWHWAGLGLILLLGYYSRETFLAFLMMLPVVFLLRSDRTRWSAWVFAGVLVCGFWLALQLREAWFPHSPEVSWKDLLAVGAAGSGSNMSPYFAVPPIEASWPDIARKAAKNLLIQVDPRWAACWLFYVPFNIMAVLCLWSLATHAGRGSRPARLAEAGVAFLLVHLQTIVLVQNHARYMLVAVPAVLAGAPLAPRLVRWLRDLRYPGRILAGLVVLLALADLPLALRLRSEGRTQGQQQADILASLPGGLRSSDSVLMEVVGLEYLMVGYTLRPRPVLFLEAERSYTRAQLETMRERIAATWLLCRTNSPLLAAYATTNAPAGLAPPSALAGYGWYRLGDAPAR